MRGMRLGFAMVIVSVVLLWTGVSEADRRGSSSHHGKTWSDYRRYSDKDKYLQYSNKHKHRRHSHKDKDRRYSKKHKHERHSNKNKLLECRADLKSRTAKLKKARSQLGKAKGRLRRRTRQLRTCNAELDRTQEDLASCKKELEMCGSGGTSDTAPVPQTGQMECWDSAGMSILCAGTGQDGEIQAGKMRPDPRFMDNMDGTVTDNLTGLMWLQNAFCPDTTLTWQEALRHVENLNMNLVNCGNPGIYTDWRLPNVKELLSLIDYGFVFPALSDFTRNPDGSFEGPFMDLKLANSYWSSTSFTGAPSLVWLIAFGTGDTSAAGKGLFDKALVLPVRGGQ